MSVSDQPILLVDDAMINIKLMRQILQTAGHRTIDCGTGGDALTLAAKFIPELILLDIDLPDMDGYEVLRRLKAGAVTQEIPVLFITGSTGPEAVVKGLKAGAVDYITKPFNGEELLARVQTHLELHRSRATLKELLATKDKLFSIISHDLRGPIGAISSILQSDYFTPGSYSEQANQRMFEMLRNTADKSYQLLENLLEWAKSQRGQMLAQPVMIAVRPLVKEVVELFDYKLSEKAIGIHYEIPSDSVVYADRKILQTVLRNLLSNSLKFTPRGGRIGFSFLTQGDRGRLTVSDTGAGISPEVLEKLLKPGGYFSTKGTEGEGGSGLGLILCRELTEKSSGRLTLESQVGRGTSVHLDLPLEPHID